MASKVWDANAKTSRCVAAVSDPIGLLRSRRWIRWVFRVSSLFCAISFLFGLYLYRTTFARVIATGTAIQYLYTPPLAFRAVPPFAVEPGGRNRGGRRAGSLCTRDSESTATRSSLASVMERPYRPEHRAAAAGDPGYLFYRIWQTQTPPPPGVVDCRVTFLTR